MTIDVVAAARRRTRALVLMLVLAATTTVAVVAGLVLASPGAGPAVGVASSPGVAASPPPGPSPVAGALLPEGVVWTRLCGVDLPVSVQAGPSRTSGDLAGGFAHSRAGAVTAALHLLVRTTTQVGPAVFEPTIAAQVTGEHAAAMARAVADDYRRAAAQAGLVYGQPLGDLPAHVAGIRVDAYTDTRARLSLLTAATDAAGLARYAATAVTLIWSGEDWLLLAPPQGRWDDLVRLVEAAQAADYTPIGR